MTQYRHLKVADGRLRQMADTDNFVTTSAGREVEILEIVYAGMTTQNFTLDFSTPYSLGGVDHVFGISVTTDAGASADIVATGLKLKHTNNTAETACYIGGNSNPSSFLTNLIGKRRFYHGRWAYWVKLASGWSIPSTHWLGIGIRGGDYLTGQTGRIFRGRNFNGTTNDTTGGIVTLSTFRGTETLRLGGDFDTHDVMGVYVNARTEMYFLSGVWSGGWPDFESLTLQAYAVHMTRAASSAVAGYSPITDWYTDLRVSGPSSTWEPVIERVRFTAYD